MNKKLFSELLASLREGGAIMRGEIKPSRRFKVINGEPVLCVDEPEIRTGVGVVVSVSDAPDLVIDEMDIPCTCGDCGRPLQAVRPGEWQCEWTDCPSNRDME